MGAVGIERGAGWAACALVTSVVLSTACSSPSSTPFSVEDAGASVRDAEPRLDAGASDSSPPARFGAAEDRGDPVACSDFLDDTSGGGADCSDMHCASTSVCCVESTSTTCCGVPEISGLALDFRTASCAVDSPASLCGTGVSGFGTALSAFIQNVDDAASCSDGMGAMAPQGGPRSDAGLLFTASQDTGATALRIEAHVGLGSAQAGSIDAIAVGLTAQTDLGPGEARVRPLVAVVVSATDQTIRVVAGDVLFDPVSLTGSFGTSECHELDVRLDTRPDGTFDAFFRHHGAAAWTDLERGRSYQTAPGSHPIVYGRTTNPGITGVHAWVRSVGVAAHVCDVLAPSRSTTTVLRGVTTSGAIRSVSRLAGRAAYELDGTAYVAGVDGTGAIDATAATTLLAPEAGSFFEAGVLDPELAQVGANVRLYFTGRSAAGVRSIGYLDFTADLSARVNGSTPRALFAPTEIGVLGADGPAYLETSEAGGVRHRLLVFRATVADTSALGGTRTEIRALELMGENAILGAADEAVITAAGAPRSSGFYSRMSPFSLDEALYANRASDDTAFDRDEVAQPEVVLYHDVYRIFFAGRRGARWSIGILRSADLSHFDLAGEDAALTATGVGFDAVSVSDPDVVVLDDQLALYYSGDDGVETRPGLATQTIPL